MSTYATGIITLGRPEDPKSLFGSGAGRPQAPQGEERSRALGKHVPRSVFRPNTWEQYDLLSRLSPMIDKGQISTTLAEVFRPISAANLTGKHDRIWQRRVPRKMVIVGFLISPRATEIWEKKMLSKEQRQAASDFLWQHWQQGHRANGLPEAMRPTTRAEGYAIQSLIESRSAKPIFGWKIAATSQEGQAHIGVDGPLAGRLLAERVVTSGATLPLKTNLMRVAELELGFLLGRDIAPRPKPYTIDEVMNVVDALHVGIEIPDSRFEDFVTAGAPQLLADDACADYYVLGPAAPEQWRSLDLSKHKVKGIVAGKYDRDGLGGNVLGDPRIALTWLANELSKIGVSLKAGQVVTTGTCLLPLEVDSGDEVTGDFGQLGRVSVRLS